MQQQRTLDKFDNNGAAASGGFFNPYEECHAVHPVHGNRCMCVGVHNQHWAMFPGENERTIFSSWVGAAPSPQPVVMTVAPSSERIYPVWQKNAIKLAVIIVVLAIGYLAFSALSWLLL